METGALPIELLPCGAGTAEVQRRGAGSSIRSRGNLRAGRAGALTDRDAEASGATRRASCACSADIPIMSTRPSMCRCPTVLRIARARTVSRPSASSNNTRSTFLPCDTRDLLSPASRALRRLRSGRAWTPSATNLRGGRCRRRPPRPASRGAGRRSQQTARRLLRKARHPLRNRIRSHRHCATPCPEWTLAHSAELEANWARGKTGEPLERIAPLD